MKAIEFLVSLIFILIVINAHAKAASVELIDNDIFTTDICSGLDWGVGGLIPTN
ncbi:MAG: hypothetical protein KAT04_15720 [Methylococcales bacterium]|nr:hypothetical protein [Methylococcales bacterium]